MMMISSYLPFFQKGKSIKFMLDRLPNFHKLVTVTYINPIALKTATVRWSFDHSECNIRMKRQNTVNKVNVHALSRETN